MGDLNGDGNPDLVTANVSDHGVSVLWNAGDATYPSRTDYPTATGAELLALGDLDRNSKLDMLIADNHQQSSAINVLFNNGNGDFVSHLHYDAEPWPKLALVDLNHDDKLDLLGTNGEPDGVMVRLGLGDGTFGSMLKSLTNNGSISPYSAALGDLNGDGHLDLVSPEGSSTRLDVMLRVGDGTFTAMAQHVVKGNSGAGEVALGDLNGDGLLDVAWRDLV